MRTCQEYLEILSASVDGEATAAELEHLDAHLRECPACAKARAQMVGIGAILKADASDYLDSDTPTLVNAILAEKDGGGGPPITRWPTWRSVLKFKILPSLGVMSWCWLLFSHPEAFRAWPLLAVLVFALGFKLAGRPSAESVRPWFENSMRPLSWGLGMITLLPISAVLNGQTPDRWALPGGFEVAGVGLGLVGAAATGVICGMLRVVSPKLWRQDRTAPMLLAAAGAAGGVAGVSLAGLASIALLLVYSLWKLQAGLNERPVAGEDVSNMVPRYPLGVLSVDLLGFWILAAGNFAYQHTTSELEAVFVPGSLWPVAIWLWWVLVRIPLASLVELAQGHKLRWVLAGFLGLAGCAGLSMASELAVYGWSLMMLLAIGLAATGRRATTHERGHILRQRLRAWTLLPLVLTGVTGLVLGNWDSVPVKPDPKPLPQIVRPAKYPSGVEEPAVKPEDDGLRYLEREVKYGLEAEIFDFDNHYDADVLRAEFQKLPKTMSYLRENLAHLDQALKARGLSTPTNRGYELTQLLFAAALLEFEQGRTEAGMDRLQQLYRLRWWGGGSYGLAIRILLVVERYPLTRQQYQRLLAMFSDYPTDFQLVVSAADLGYHEGFSRIAEWSPPPAGKLDLPLRYRKSIAQTRLNELDRWYLQYRSEMTPAWNEATYQDEAQYRVFGIERELRREFSQINFALAAIGAKLYRAEPGHNPRTLAEIETRVGRKLYDYNAKDGQFRYDGRKLSGDSGECEI